MMRPPVIRDGRSPRADRQSPRRRSGRGPPPQPTARRAPGRPADTPSRWVSRARASRRCRGGGSSRPCGRSPGPPTGGRRRRSWAPRSGTRARRGPCETATDSGVEAGMSPSSRQRFTIGVPSTNAHRKPDSPGPSARSVSTACALLAERAHLRPVADDPRIGEQRRLAIVVVGGDARRVEPLVGGAVAVAPVQRSSSTTARPARPPGTAARTGGPRRAAARPTRCRGTRPSAGRCPPTRSASSRRVAHASGQPLARRSAQPVDHLGERRLRSRPAGHRPRDPRCAWRAPAEPPGRPGRSRRSSRRLRQAAPRHRIPTPGRPRGHRARSAPSSAARRSRNSSRTAATRSGSSPSARESVSSASSSSSAGSVSRSSARRTAGGPRTPRPGSTPSTSRLMAWACRVTRSPTCSASSVMKPVMRSTPTSIQRSGRSVRTCAERGWSARSTSVSRPPATNVVPTSATGAGQQHVPDEAMGVDHRVHDAAHRELRARASRPARSAAWTGSAAPTGIDRSGRTLARSSSASYVVTMLPSLAHTR